MAENSVVSLTNDDVLELAGIIKEIGRIRADPLPRSMKDVLIAAEVEEGDREAHPSDTIVMW
jgi:hypothetical protein